MYQITHNGYCGMNVFRKTVETKSEAREIAAERLSRLRRKFNVAILSRGKEWEVLDPENCHMVPDLCGIVAIEHIQYACQECGSEYETPEDAYECCFYLTEDDSNE